MRGSLEDLGGDREYISLLLSGFRSEVPNCQPLVRIWLEEIFCFSCSGFLKVGISNNDLRIGTLHINIWLAAFKKKNKQTQTIWQHWVHILTAEMGSLVLLLS